MKAPSLNTIRRKWSTAAAVLRTEGPTGLLRAARLRAGRRMLGSQLSSHFPVVGRYELRDGSSVQVYAGYREALKPLHFLAHATERGFESYLRDNGDQYLVRAAMAAATQFVDRMERELGLRVSGKRVLEVGCGDGAMTYVMAARGAEVVGLDKDWSYIRGLDSIRGKLQSLCLTTRGAVRTTTKEIERAVTIVRADIESGSGFHGPFDIIVSNSVLEHVPDLRRGMETMVGLLRRRGLMVHCFNPFFSETGGHEFCTLDFPWGHVRQAPEDVAKYLEIYRGWEISESIALLSSAFNDPRLTLDEIDACARALGLSVVAAAERRLCWWRCAETPHEILRQCRRVYPRVEWQDLSSDEVWRVYSLE